MRELLVPLCMGSIVVVGLVAGVLGYAFGVSARADKPAPPTTRGPTENG